MENLDTRINFLSQFPLFKNLSETEKRTLAQSMERKVFRRYKTIYTPGDSSGKLFLLEKGTVKISTHSDDGREVIKSLIHPIAMFGEMGLVGEESRKDFAQVLKEDVQVYILEVAQIKSLMQTNFTLCNDVMSLFGSRLMRAENKLEALIFKDARTRIIDFIKDSIMDRGRRIGYEMLLRHSLTHQDIANITCTSRQTVTLVLNELKKSNLIHFNRGKILVRDMEALA